MKIVNGRKAALYASAAAIGIVLPATASAQDADVEMAQPATDEFEGSGEFSSGNEIIVTATKREQTLQEIPVAVSVTSAETIENAAIRDLADLQTVVPSLRVNTLQSSANTNFIIRGFGNGANNAGIEPSVGVFVDGVYRSRTASQINDLPDVQRVEVLRGPQSTLFGKNASAGIISIVTREPQFTPEGSAEFSYGNYNAIVAKGYATGPVSDNFAVSLAAGLNMRDGYLEDLGTGEDFNERNRYFVRGQALVEPTENFRFRLIADYDQIDENCCGVVNLQSSLATQIITGIGGQVTDPDDPFADVVTNNLVSRNEVENYGVSGQFDVDLGAVSLTSITSLRKSDLFTDQDSDFTSADLIQRNSLDQQIETFTQEVRASFELGSFFSALLGAYYFDEGVDTAYDLQFGDDFRPFANAQIVAGTGGALDVGGLEQTIGLLTASDPTVFAGQFFAQGTGQVGTGRLDNEAFSIFGQLDIDIVDGLTLTLGGNYTIDDKRFALDFDTSDTFATIDLVDVGNTAIFAEAAPQFVAGGLCQAVPGYCAGPIATQAELAAFAGGQPEVFAQIQAGALAQAQAFADANDTNPAVNPLLSLRPLQFSTPFVDVPNAVEDGETSDDNFSYTVRLAYDVAPELNVYASYATGFKASSVNLSRDSRPLFADRGALASNNLLLANSSFGSRFASPEKSKVFEVGAKANLDRVSVNLAVFDQTIEGFQSNIFTGTGFALANAGEQSTFGVELESTWFPTDALTLNFGATYLDPKYDSFENSAVGDLTGTTPAGIPELTMNIGAQYGIDVGNGDEIVLRGGYFYASETQIAEGLPGFIQRDALGNVISYQPARDAAEAFTREVNQVDASITYRLSMGLDIQLWGRNLLDDRYITTIFDSVAQSRAVSGYPNQPRTYGAAVRYKW